MQITLSDLLNFGEDIADNIKIRFNQSNSIENPLDLYQKNPDIVNNQWLLWRSKKRYFQEGQIAISFLKLTTDTWLLTTIKKITKDLDIENGISYEGVELEEYRKYYGRVIVKFHKTFQSQCVYYKSLCDELIVNQILPTTFDGYDFPGYDKVRLSFEQLETVINQHKKDWVAALENQKAVYLITDTHNGKLYVGSATGDHGMLLQRWKNYVKDGHGGNVDLKSLVEKEGFDYVKKNFQYSILENYNAKVDDHVILERESWWKDILQSRKHGYNKN